MPRGKYLNQSSSAYLKDGYGWGGEETSSLNNQLQIYFMPQTTFAWQIKGGVGKTTTTVNLGT